MELEPIHNRTTDAQRDAYIDDFWRFGKLLELEPMLAQRLSL